MIFKIGIIIINMAQHSRIPWQAVEFSLKRFAIALVGTSVEVYRHFIQDWLNYYKLNAIYPDSTITIVVAIEAVLLELKKWSDDNAAYHYISINSVITNGYKSINAPIISLYNIIVLSWQLANIIDHIKILNYMKLVKLI